MAVKCILTGQTPSVLDGVTENVQTQLNDKVDKVTGKGLSANDYTNAEKTKLSGIETGAQKNTITGVKGSAETTYRTGNVNITATNIGLGNVDNTSDANKPISNATQAALNDKQSKITANGILKGNGTGGVSAAVKGTDYAAPSVGVTATLSASGWDANAKTQTVSVAVVTATDNCIITAAPDSYMSYAKAGVRCTAQGDGTLTFACETVPTANVAANVLILG